LKSESIITTTPCWTIFLLLWQNRALADLTHHLTTLYFFFVNYFDRERQRTTPKAINEVASKLSSRNTPKQSKTIIHALRLPIHTNKEGGQPNDHWWLVHTPQSRHNQTLAFKDFMHNTYTYSTFLEYYHHIYIIPSSTSIML
jgi:hypothetical protein